MIILKLYLELNAKKQGGHKILTPKQILQRLPIALAQGKGVNILEIY